jgi:diacylglycerol kinase (ATP)
MPQRVIVIHSPHSGRSSKLPDAIKQLEHAGLEVVKSISIAKLDDLPAQGTVWKESEMDVAIAAGGDGLVGGVITRIAESGLPLGILPLCASNDIARTLHIPQDIGEAAYIIAQGREQEVDIGMAQPPEQATLPATPSPSGPVPEQVVPQKQAFFAHALTVGVSKIACSIVWCSSTWTWVLLGKTSLVSLVQKCLQRFPCQKGTGMRLSITLPSCQVSRVSTMCKRQE